MGKWMVIGSIGLLLLIVTLYVWGNYASLVSQKVDSEVALADVYARCQQRHDLVPRMVKSADASMKFQVELPVQYAEKREGLEAADKKYRELLKDKDPESLEQADKAWGEVQKNWEGIQVLVNARSEAVPQANLDQLTELNNEMAALESVIAGKRQDYNKVAGQYKKSLETPPTSWFGSMWGFKPMKLFEAEEGAEKAPEVNFDLNFTRG